jgi:hypothetical protein
VDKVLQIYNTMPINHKCLFTIGKHNLKFKHEDKLFLGHLIQSKYKGYIRGSIKYAINKIWDINKVGNYENKNCISYGGR